MGDRSTPVYGSQGGDERTFDSGATLRLKDGSTQVLEDGAVIELGSGVTLTITGTDLVLAGLPTTDPGVTGALWANSNVLTLGTES